MAKAASSEELQGAFKTHLEETKGQVEPARDRSSRCSRQAPKGKTCKAMEGLIEEGEELIDEDAEPEVLDAGLIAAAQRVEHYEIAGYGTVRTYAKLLGGDEAAKLLQETLDEGLADKKLTQIAESLVNREALAAAER